MSSVHSPVHRPLARRSAARLIALTSVAWVGFGCSRKEKPPPEAVVQASASAPASAPQTGAPAPSAAQTSWCTGAWTGTYRTAAHRIELPTSRGGIPEWKADDGKAFIGPGTIELACADDGSVTGSVHGVLGEQEIRGESNEASLHARLVPKSTTPPVFSGTVTLSHAGAEVTGDLQASTHDGRVARTATVTLARRAE